MRPAPTVTFAVIAFALLAAAVLAGFAQGQSHRLPDLAEARGCANAWPPKPQNIINGTGTVTLLKGSGQVVPIYSVPSGSAFVLTDLSIKLNTTAELVEDVQGSLSVKLPTALAIFSPDYEWTVGLHFSPGSDVAIHEASANPGGTGTVDYFFNGYLTPE